VRADRIWRVAAAHVFWCPLNARSGRAARVSHSRTELSLDEASKCSPSAESCTDETSPPSD
jgi:hypothetical protein